MYIYMDGQPLLGNRSGISRYVSSLYQSYCMNNDMQVSLAFNRIIKNINYKDLFDNYNDEGRLKIENQRYPYKIIRRLLKPNFLYEFPFDFLKKKSPDIFHGTNFVHHPVRKGKSIITIHDLAYMKYPETTSDRILKHHSKWVPYSAQKCDHIIADSRQTKSDIIELLHIEEEKITSIPLAADKHFIPMSKKEIIPVLNKHHLPEQYILFVGTLEPRKNLLGLLKSYLIYKKNADQTIKLVIVGAKGWKYSPIFDYIQDNNLVNDVIFTGYIDDHDLPAIYNGATIFVMPSIYEGFGIPILEAMGCGIPVIGSNVSSIPEIIDRYGILVAPHDYENWAREIYTLVNSSSLLENYSNLSLERAGHFSWERTAQMTKQVYQDVLNSNLTFSGGKWYEGSVGTRLSEPVRGRGAGT